MQGKLMIGKLPYCTLFVLYWECHDCIFSLASWKLSVTMKGRSERPLSRQTRSWRQTSKVRDKGGKLKFFYFIFLGGWVEARRELVSFVQC
jgi:hypothetical protein